MPNPRRLWLLAAALPAAVVLLLAYLSTDRAPATPAAGAPTPSIAEVSSPGEARSPAPPAPPGPGPVQSPEPEAPRAPGAPEQPPTVSALDTEEADREISPESPETPKWKLEKTTLIAEALAKRVQRLEKDVREAEAKGERQLAAERRTLLERSQKRMGELEREIGSLKEQVQGDGGKP